MKNRVVLGTMNPSKLEEMQSYFTGTAFIGVSPREVTDRVPEIPESADTVRGNAILKAKAWHRMTGFPVIAEDSGLLFMDLAQSDPDQPGQFVRRFLMEEYQSSLDSCLPISKKAIKAQGQAVIDSFEEQNAELEEEMNAQGMEVYNETGSEDAAEAPTGDEITEVTDDVDSSETESEDMTGKPIPEKDFDGTHEEYEKYVKEFKEDMKKAESDTTAEEVIVAPEEIDAGDTAQAYGLDSLPEFGQADLDKMQKILDNLSFSVNSENDVLNIILEEAGAYFAGQKSTEEVSDIIQSRIQVYLKENE